MPESVAGGRPGPAMTQLQPLPYSAYPAYVAAAAAAYAQEKLDAGHWPAATALERARDEFAALLPLGLATPQQYLFQLLPSSQGPVVGWLWLALETTAGEGNGDRSDDGDRDRSGDGDCDGDSDGSGSGSADGGRYSGFNYDLRILPEYRRRGHAGRALQAVELLARTLGANSLALQVFANNPAALALYRQQGYRVSSLNMDKHW